MEPTQQFGTLIDQFAGSPGVEAPGAPSARGFGSSALKVNGSIFAMLSGGRLVLKLPGERVRALLASGVGSPFDAGKGRPMKEWVTVVPDDVATWVELAREALEFVGSRQRDMT